MQMSNKTTDLSGNEYSGWAISCWINKMENVTIDIDGRGRVVAMTTRFFISSSFFVLPVKWKQRQLLPWPSYSGGFTSIEWLEWRICRAECHCFAIWSGGEFSVPKIHDLRRRLHFCLHGPLVLFLPNYCWMPVVGCLAPLYSTRTN